MPGTDVDTTLFSEGPKGPIPIRGRRNQFFGKFMGIAPLKRSPQRFGTKGRVERTRPPRLAPSGGNGQRGRAMRYHFVSTHMP